MSKKIPFTKMQGAGNDYVYINLFETEVSDPGSLAIKASDRHFGVGSDGLVLIAPSKAADLRMRMFNADGSEAEMCGNASRCVGKLAHDLGLVKKNVFTLETGAGIKTIELHLENKEVVSVTVDMGEPILEPDLIPVLSPEREKNAENPLVGMPLTVNGREYSVTPVSMGNPHAVLFVDDTDSLDLPAIGPLFENHAAFPGRTNTEFAEIVDSGKIRMRVWERGAGETLACGTGACATLVASVLNGLTSNEADLLLPGGTLRIKWNRENNHIYMTGPAVTVFTGEYLL